MCGRAKCDLRSDGRDLSGRVHVQWGRLAVSDEVGYIKTNRSTAGQSEETYEDALLYIGLAGATCSNQLQNFSCRAQSLCSRSGTPSTTHAHNEIKNSDKSRTTAQQIRSSVYSGGRIIRAHRPRPRVSGKDTLMSQWTRRFLPGSASCGNQPKGIHGCVPWP